MNMLTNSRGVTLLETMIAIMITTFSIFMAMTYASVVDNSSQLTRNASTKNRITSGIRNFAAMPATLRTSMRAATNGVTVNPQLLACAGGNPANSCTTGVEYPFTMFSPLLARDAAGNILGVQALTAPLGSTTPMRLDSFGSPCKVTSPQCPFLVFTTMKAQCGPPPLAVTATPTKADLAPRASCTVADVIEVTYYIQLDPAVVAQQPSLASTVEPIVGSVTVAVQEISGNVPQ